jgi:hypothetical protein
MRTRLVAALAVVLLGAGCAPELPMDKSHLDARTADSLRLTFVNVHNGTLALRRASRDTTAWEASHPGLDQAVYNADKGYLLDLTQTENELRQTCVESTSAYNDIAALYADGAFTGQDIPRYLAQTDPVFTTGRASWPDYDCTVH